MPRGVEHPDIPVEASGQLNALIDESYAAEERRLSYERPRLFVDHNVSMRTVERLRRLRLTVETAFEERLSTAKDEEVLLFAATRGALLLTHDEHDYKLLFRAWHRWCNAWALDRITLES